MFRFTPIRFAFFSSKKSREMVSTKWLQHFNITQDTPGCSNKNLYKMSLWKNIYQFSPSSIQEWSLQNDWAQGHFLGKTLPGTEWWFMPGMCPPILCWKFQGGCINYHLTIVIRRAHSSIIYWFTTCSLQIKGQNLKVVGFWIPGYDIERSLISH